MTRLHAFSKCLVCAMLIGGLTPATANADPDYVTVQQSNPARPPKVVIVASDNVTVIKIIDCKYQMNVGACLDMKLAAEGSSLTAIDSNRTIMFLQGAARVGSTSGSRALEKVTYGYDDLFIEGDIQLRAAE